MDEIEKFTRFPLKTYGVADADPIIKFDKDRFGEVFSVFLDQYAGIDLEGGTEFDYIKDGADIVFKSGADYDNASNYIKTQRIEGNYASIFDMDFELDNNCWKLSSIVFLDETYKKLGITTER